ncbi:hypothetical protein ASG58_11415 [Rhizobium sp. Leaf383]|nr:hypothetical protein ASG58_11415 [Rhizobium sp. Leaf383]
MIRGNPGTVLGSGMPFAEYRKTGNILSRRQQATGRFPGLYFMADEAALVVRDCQWVVIEKLLFRDCWPTATYLDNCQNVIIRDISFEGGTFAIATTGNDTRHILVEECSWVQDLSGRGREDLKNIREDGHPDPSPPPADTLLWKMTDWNRVHGARQDGFPVDVAKDARGLDGDFFRAWNIAGHVVIRKNVVIDAFNGVHFFSDGATAAENGCSRNVLVEKNWFVRVRDNAVEPETFAWNWTVRHNRFVDCYVPFSFELESSGYFYLYGNLGWNRYRPGPEGDTHVNGQLFKFGERHEAVGPHYVFNNTWILDIPIVKRRRFSNFRHFNNAIAYRSASGKRIPEPRSVFGNDSESYDDPRLSLDEAVAFEGSRFTKRWTELAIYFDGDWIDHPMFPDGLRAQGYPIGAHASGERLHFHDAGVGSPEGLRLRSPRPAKSAEIELPDGRKRFIDSKKHLVGAWQNTGPLALDTAPFAAHWND